MNLSALLAVLLWSTVSTAFKLALKTLTPLQLIFYSTLFSTLCFLVVVLIQKKLSQAFREFKKDPLYYLFTGLCNPLFYYLVLFKAYSLLPADMAQPLNYTWPIALSLLSVPFLKKKFSIKQTIALVISFGGIYIISQRGGSSETFSLQGILLALSSAFIWAFYWILDCRKETDKSIKLFLNFIISLIILLPLTLFSGQLIWPGTGPLSATLYIGLFEMGITFLLWSRGLAQSSNPGKTANLAFLSPVLSLFIIHKVLGTPLQATAFAGLSLIIFSIILSRK